MRSEVVDILLVALVMTGVVEIALALLSPPHTQWHQWSETYKAYRAWRLRRKRARAIRRLSRFIGQCGNTFNKLGDTAAKAACSMHTFANALKEEKRNRRYE